MSTPIYSIRDAQRANERAGQSWFSAGSMRFFSTRLSEDVFANEKSGMSYFVTSERCRGNNEPRLYSVRSISWATGQVDTVGEFQGYRTLAQAKTAAKRASA